MSPTPFRHTPVLLAEVVELFRPVPAGVVLDGTLGGGGHAEALLENCPQLRILGLDRDAIAIAAAAEKLARFGDRAVLVQERFERLAVVAAAQGALPLSGVLLDLGVSSPQLDDGERGFSHRADAALDMRMDRRQSVTAAEVVNTYDEQRLAKVLRDHADERFASRIARAIVSRRPVLTTGKLAEIVRDAIPAAARRTGGHPAARSFQAVRIEVNGELEQLPDAVDAAIDASAPGGRVVVLSYHSGEDRIVKGCFRRAETAGCTCPPRLGCVCGAIRKVRLIRRGGVTAGPAELTTNPRAGSVRLRAAEILPQPHAESAPRQEKR